jgi:hypothetical protein
MVYMVQIAQDLSEKGAGKKLLGCKMLAAMVATVADIRKDDSLYVMYCADGSGHPFDMDGIEQKVLARLLAQRLPDVNIVHVQFSFHEDEALKKLQAADIFYFKGFGGGVGNILPIFGKRVFHATLSGEVLHVSQMAQRVAAFQEKCMFHGMLTFMICGAAVISGTHYPGHAELQGLQLLGDAHVQYHACGTTSSIQVATNDNTLQLVPGVANIISCEGGVAQVETVVVSRDSPSHYWDCAEKLQLHLNTVMKVNMYTWRIYYWTTVGPTKNFWACRTDGKCTFGSFEELLQSCTELPEHISDIQYNLVGSV